MEKDMNAAARNPAPGEQCHGNPAPPGGLARSRTIAMASFDPTSRAEMSLLFARDLGYSDD